MGSHNLMVNFPFQELEKETTDRVRAMFNDIDDILYSSNDDDVKGSGLSREILEECEIWKLKFPHLRVVGKSLQQPDNFQVPKIFPAFETQFSESRLSPEASGTSSSASTISTISINECHDHSEDDETEVIASHGTYVDEDLENILGVSLDGMATNPR